MNDETGIEGVSINPDGTLDVECGRCRTHFTVGINVGEQIIAKVLANEQGEPVPTPVCWPCADELGWSKGIKR